MEIVRFGIVGVICFILDAGTLTLMKQVVFHGSASLRLLIISTTVAFVVGVAANYLLSLFIVFNRPDQRRRGQGWRPMTLFFVGAFIGLLLTDAIMAAGTHFTGRTGYSYLLVKVVATGIVMVWNYVTRKLIIFH